MSRSTYRARWSPRVLCAAFALILLSQFPPRAYAADSGLSSRGEAAFQQISQCIARTQTLLATIVVDHSGSLRETDPAPERRPDAVVAIIDALADLATTSSPNGNAVHVEANLMTFGAEINELTPWGLVDPSHAEEMRSAANAYLRNDGPKPLEQFTDYRIALSSAQQSLETRLQEIKDPACSIILWFTDGKLDVNVSGADAMDDFARAELCTAGGIVDTARRQGTHIIVLSLFSDDESIRSELRPDELDRDRLQAMAEYRAGDETCGTDSGAAGVYLDASDTAELWRRFVGVGALLQGASPGAIGMRNDTGPIRFPVDPAVGRVLLVFTALGDAPVRLDLPDGTEIDLRAGYSGMGLLVQVAGTDGFYAVTISDHDGLAGGIWQIPQAGANESIVVTDLYYFWDVSVDISAPDGVVLDQQNTITITRNRGAVPDFAGPQWYSQVAADITIDGQPVPAGSITDNGDGTYSFPVDLAGQTAAAQIDVTATMSAESNGSNIPLGPVTGHAVFPVSLPVEFPVLETTSLDFGRFAVGSAQTIPLTIRGPDAGSTRICFGSATWRESSLDDAPIVNVDGVDGNCVDLAAAAVETVNVSVSTTGNGDGPLSGTLPATLRGANTDRTTDLSIPLNGILIRPVDTTRQFGLSAAFLLGSLVLAWSVASIARHLTDRYQEPNGLRLAQVPVLVTAGGVTHPGRGPLTSQDLDFRDQRLEGARHRPQIVDLQFGRRGPVAWPWREYRPVASASNSDVIVNLRYPGSGSQRAARNGAETAEASFVVPEAAFLVVPSEAAQSAAGSGSGVPANGAIPGRLYIFLDPQPGEGVAGHSDSWLADLSGSGEAPVEWRNVYDVAREAVNARLGDDKSAAVANSQSTKRGSRPRIAQRKVSEGSDSPAAISDSYVSSADTSTIIGEATVPENQSQPEESVTPEKNWWE